MNRWDVVIAAWEQLKVVVEEHVVIHALVPLKMVAVVIVLILVKIHVNKHVLQVQQGLHLLVVSVNHLVLLVVRIAQPHLDVLAVEIVANKDVRKVVTLRVELVVIIYVIIHVKITAVVVVILHV